jgi:peptidoglycan/xylan/chitin deacetylase (PgdA/CDA1 family)
MPLTNLLRRVHGRIAREAAARLARRPHPMQNTGPLISFTFDDFPRSSATIAAPVLEEHGVRGTYYTSFGLMGQTAPTGEIFRREDLDPLLRAGHELGCHTYAHCHSWNTPPAVFEENVLQNGRTLKGWGVNARFESLSYPISCPRPATKRRVAKHFAGCRAGGQTFNRGVIDLDHLQAFFIEQSREQPEAILRMIDSSVAANGWLIFATHDVCDHPTRFGCTPKLFRSIVEHARRSGAQILSVARALREIGALAD